MTSLRRKLERQQPFIVINRPSPYGSEYPVPRRYTGWWVSVAVTLVIVCALVVWGPV